MYPQTNEPTGMDTTDSVEVTESVETSETVETDAAENTDAASASDEAGSDYAPDDSGTQSGSDDRLQS